MKKILDVQSVCVGYDGTAVASDLTLDVQKGETFGLIGVNGAGKTSLIKSIIGLKEKMDGKIVVCGSDVLDRSTKKRFGYLPERFDPPWFLTGEEFVKFTLQLYDRPYNKEVLYEYCNDIKLDSAFLSKKMTTYSKGMRQKLGLVATLISGVDFLILDEPMSGLDPIARVSVKKLMTRAIENGQTIFLSSHILSDLDDLCDRIAILHDKRIQFIGPPNELKSKYDESSLERAFLHLVEVERKKAS